MLTTDLLVVALVVLALVVLALVLALALDTLWVPLSRRYMHHNSAWTPSNHSR
jgi:hypothetical protein